MKLIGCLLIAGGLVCPGVAPAQAQGIGMGAPGHVIGNGGTSNPGEFTDYPINKVISAAGGLLGTIDLSAYNVSGSAQTTTGTINAGSASLSVAAALDFQNGQGILVNHAGAAYTIGQVSGLTASQVGSAGATTYTYKVSTCDANGGVGAPVTSATVANGPAQLTPANYIQLSWNAPGGTTPNCYIVWRSLNGGAYQFLFAPAGTSIRDNQLPYPSRPFWIPATPPASALADWLVTTISAGAGTTTLTLAVTATTNATTTFVAHDDTAGFLAWGTAIQNAVNAGGPVLATVPGSFSVRISGSGPVISNAANLTINANGASCLPAGVAPVGNFAWCIALNGPGLGSQVGTVEWAEGTTSASLSATTGYVSGNYLLAIQPSPNIGTNTTITPVQVLSGTTATTSTNAPLNYKQVAEYATLSGTVTAGNVPTITATSGGISGSPVSISYTVQGGDTLASIAHNLANNINRNAALAAAGIFAFDEGSVVNIVYPTSLTVAWSQSCAGCTESIVLSNAAFSSFYWWLPGLNVTLTNFTGDGSNTAGGAFNMVQLYSLGKSNISKISGTNFSGGGVLYTLYGYDNLYSNITAWQSGTPVSADIWINNETNTQIDAIRSVNATGFGPQTGGTSWLQLSNLSSINAGGRGFKMLGDAHATLANIHSEGGPNPTPTNITLESVYKATFYGCQGIGVSGNASGTGVTTFDSFTRSVYFHGCEFIGNTRDIEVGLSDQDINFYGTRAGVVFDAAGNIRSLNTSYVSNFPSLLGAPISFQANAFITGNTPFFGADGLANPYINAASGGVLNFAINNNIRASFSNGLTTFNGVGASAVVVQTARLDAGNTLGLFKFQGQNSTPATTTFSYWLGQINSNVAGSESGSIYGHAFRSGVDTNEISIGGGVGVGTSGNVNGTGTITADSAGFIGTSGSVRGTLTMYGTSGSQVWRPAAAASGTITWPAGTVDFSATGGANQFVKQASAGGIFTVGPIGNSDIAAAGAALTRVNDTNVTLTLDANAPTALVNASQITVGWAGQLGLTRGGTNNSLTASNGGVVWSDASKLNILAGTATANLPLLSGATATPAWAAIAYPTSATSGGVAYFSSTTAMASSALMTLNGVMYGGGAGNPPLSTAQGGTNTVLAANAGAPSFTAALALNTSLAVPIIGPLSNSTTALKITKADLATALMTFDTTNSVVGIGPQGGVSGRTLTLSDASQPTFAFYSTGGGSGLKMMGWLFDNGTNCKLSDTTTAIPCLIVQNLTDAGAFAGNNIAFFRDGSLTIGGSVSLNEQAAGAFWNACATDATGTGSNAGCNRMDGGLGVTKQIWAGTTIATGTTTVGSLPTCNAAAKGKRYFVTDANANTYHTTAAGGGANNVGVTCDGTNWYISANDNWPLDRMAA